MEEGGSLQHPFMSCSIRLLVGRIQCLRFLPIFSLLLKPDGNGKLSKRDGDRLGFPVFPLDWVDPKTGDKSSGYREAGYYPEAVINFLALLGWNPGDNEEIMNMDELSEV